MLALSYFARLGNALYAWTAIGVILLLLVWGIGRDNWRISVAAIICTIAAVIVPVFGVLSGYRGLALSIAGLMSVLWLAARNWYGLYGIEPSPSFATTEGSVTRHDLLAETANYNQLEPSESTGEDVAQNLREKGVNEG
jgi:hypothetical protein